MSTTTKNLGLIKPELSDAANITATNDNWDKLDAHSHQLFEHDVSMGGNRITNVATPQSRNDVATKGFVEDFSIEGSTYVAVDENHDGNVVLRPYVPVEDDSVVIYDGTLKSGSIDISKYSNYYSMFNVTGYTVSGYAQVSVLIPSVLLGNTFQLYADGKYVSVSTSETAIGVKEAPSGGAITSIVAIK